jgi:hypothetical protein
MFSFVYYRVKTFRKYSVVDLKILTHEYLVSKFWRCLPAIGLLCFIKVR